MKPLQMLEIALERLHMVAGDPESGLLRVFPQVAVGDPEICPRSRPVTAA